MGLQIEVLYEDDFIMVLNKPNNVLVHHSYYARNIEDDSLLELAEQNNLGKLYPINRLDRKTSGLILLAKAKEFVAEFQNLFTESKIQKKYRALVRGHVMENGVIDSPVKNERGNYKEATSKYQPLEYFTLPIPVAPYPSSRYTLLEFEPITGRTHQLRIHANKIAHPIIGDHKYGNRHHNAMFENILQLPDLFLHSYSLEFIHPRTSQNISITRNPPAFWDKFRKKVLELEVKSVE